jgi:quinol monooxygenase YgiN
MSVVVVATIRPVPEFRDEVIAALSDIVGLVHENDAGCELYALHEGPDRIVFIEKWESMQALGAHGKGAAIAQLQERLAGKTLSEPDVQVLRPYPAGTPEQGAL